TRHLFLRDRIPRARHVDAEELTALVRETLVLRDLELLERRRGEPERATELVVRAGDEVGRYVARGVQHPTLQVVLRGEVEQIRGLVLGGSTGPGKGTLGVARETGDHVVVLHDPHRHAAPAEA